MLAPLATNRAAKVLTPTKMAVAEAIAEGKPYAEVARLAGVTPKTVYNYRQDPEVQRYIYNLQCAKQEESGGQTNTLLPDLVQVLKEIVTGKRTFIDDNGEEQEGLVLASNFDKIQAARVLLQANTEYQYRLKLERKISDLETRLFKLLTKEAHELAAIQAEDDEEERKLKELEEEEARVEREQEEADNLETIVHGVLDVESTTLEDPPEDAPKTQTSLAEIQEVLSALDTVVTPQSDFLGHL